MENLAGVVMLFGLLCIAAVPVALVLPKWRRHVRRLLGGGALLAVAGFVGLALTLPPAAEREAQLAADAAAAALAEAARAAAEVADREAGRHCLSISGLEVQSVVNAVKASLREPDSFEMISTSMSPLTENGRHVVLMDYRARNGFGGMNVATARAVIINADCSVEALVVE
jgi:hypothetical protein